MSTKLADVVLHSTDTARGFSFQLPEGVPRVVDVGCVLPVDEIFSVGRKEGRGEGCEKEREEKGKTTYRETKRLQRPPCDTMTPQ